MPKPTPDKSSRPKSVIISETSVKGRNHFAFSDVRRLVTKAALDDDFGILFPVPRKSAVNSLVAVLLRMTA
ncbi:hypothetical protein ACFL2E_09060 [Thermodesulfobacteriota bacterium]